MSEPTLHDTHLYDADRHDNQIVAVFEDRAAAEGARDALIAEGVGEANVQLVDKPQAAQPDEPAAESSVGDQILNAFMGLISSHEDHGDYAHAVDRGHVMLVVTPGPDADRHHIVALLEARSPIDFDAKLAEWRQAGYDGAADAGSMADGRPAGQREPDMGSSRVRSYTSGRS